MLRKMQPLLGNINSQFQAHCDAYPHAYFELSIPVLFCGPAIRNDGSSFNPNSSRGKNLTVRTVNNLGLAKHLAGILAKHLHFIELEFSAIFMQEINAARPGICP